MKSFERQKLNCWMAVVWFWIGDCTCERPNNWMNIPAVKNITIHELQQEQIMVLIWELTESKTSQKTNPVAKVKLLRNKANSFSLEKSKSKVPVCQYVHICAYIRAYTSLCFAFLALLVKQDIIFMGMKKASKWNLHIIKRHADQWELSYFEFLITLQIHRQPAISLTLPWSKLRKMGRKLKLENLFVQNHSEILCWNTQINPWPFWSCVNYFMMFASYHMFSPFHWL